MLAKQKKNILLRAFGNGMCNIAGENLVVAASDLFGKPQGFLKERAQELFRLMGRRCGLAGGRANNCGSTMETWRESGKE